MRTILLNLEPAFLARDASVGTAITTPSADVTPSTVTGLPSL